MLCVNLKKYTRPCLGVTGGVGKIWLFDPADFDFTQAAPSGGGAQPYTAIALRTGATLASGSGFFPVPFQDKEARRTWKQSSKGCSIKFEHEFKAQMPQLSQALTAFLMSLAAAGCCCGLGIAFQHNDGKIFIAGERFVNAGEIPPFIVKMDGSDGDSGALYDDFNGANVVFKADYSRELYEFTGGAAALAALEATT